MKKEILKYLESYSFDPYKINRLIVSSFLYSNGIKEVENKVIKNHFISPNDNDYDNLKAFLAIHNTINYESLVELFEFVISPVEKVITGAVYTPKSIRDFIISESFSKLGNSSYPITVCDPACGCASFLFTTAQMLKSKFNISYSEIFEYYLFGIDIQQYSVERAKLFLCLLAIHEGEDEKEYRFNIHKGNALNFNWHEYIENFTGFDLLVGNPPYVCSRNIEEASKLFLKNWSVCKTGHPDLYIPFFELGLKMLKKKGILGYITMNSFFKTINGRALRKYFSENKFDICILNFGTNQIFQSKSTYTCICIIQKTESSSIKYTRITNLNLLKKYKKSIKRIKFSELNDNDGWNLQNIGTIKKIESTGTSFGKLFITRNGIATLRNKIYIFKPVDQDKNYFYLDSDKKYPIERKICVDIVNSNKFTTADNVESITQKVIFPYYFVDNIVQIINEENFKNNFPKTHEYLEQKKVELSKRDKGKGKYETWYAYGRKQSLEQMKYKLLFPHIAKTIPNYTINTNKELLFYNGLSVIGKDEIELIILKKIMSSNLFWFYITNTSKSYGSGYYSLSRNYIKNFGIYHFSEEEKIFMIKEKNQDKINIFLEKCYGITLPKEKK